MWLDCKKTWSSVSGQIHPLRGPVAKRRFWGPVDIYLYHTQHSEINQDSRAEIMRLIASVIFEVLTCEFLQFSQASLTVNSVSLNPFTGVSGDNAGIWEWSSCVLVLQPCLDDEYMWVTFVSNTTVLLGVFGRHGVSNLTLSWCLAAGFLIRFVERLYSWGSYVPHSNALINVKLENACILRNQFVHQHPV